MQQLTFPTVSLVRRNDPHTSRIAAMVQHPHSCASDILTVLDRASRPLTGDEIWSEMSWRDDGTVKSCLSRLKKRGLVVPIGERIPEGKRVPQTCWSLPL